MRSFTFNGIDFSNYDVMLIKTPVPGNTQQQFETIQIPDGPTIIQPKKILDPITFPIECDLIPSNNIDNRLRQIYAAVQHKGILILPDETDKYYKCVLKVSTPQNIILKYHKITFTAMCEPYAYAISNNAVYCTDVSQTQGLNQFNIANAGTSKAESAITITANGEVKIWNNLMTELNAVKITLTEQTTLCIDLQIPFIYNTSNSQSLMSVSSGNLDDLLLPVGDSVIYGRNISSLSIVKNERWF